MLEEETEGSFPEISVEVSRAIAALWTPELLASKSLSSPYTHSVSVCSYASLRKLMHKQGNPPGGMASKIKCNTPPQIF